MVLSILNIVSHETLKQKPIKTHKNLRKHHTKGKNGKNYRKSIAKIQYPH